MLWKIIWDLIQAAIKHIASDVQSAQNWKVSVDGKKAGPVSHVAIGAGGVAFEFTFDSKQHRLEGRPDASNHAQVYLDGNQDAQAHLAISSRSQPLAHKPVILLATFADVTVAGTKRRIRFDCPK